MNPPDAPTVRNAEDLGHLLANIVELQRARDELWRVQEAELDAVRQRYRGQLTELQDFLARELDWAETWARNHRHAFGPDLALQTEHATLGFRAGGPRLERASRRWTWSRIAATLATLSWGARYLRTPEPVVDQDAIVADLGKLRREDLRGAGLEVLPGEQFFVTQNAEIDSSPAKLPKAA